MFTNLSYRFSDTILVVGNGAVRNGWDPVKKAFERLDGGNPLGLDPAEPFSYLVYQMRVLARRAQDDRAVEALFSRRFESLARLRHAIADEFKAAVASRAIGLKTPTSSELREALECESISIITTNWDTLLHEKYPSHPILSLHGWVNDPDTLYLPTEITFEPYRTFDSDSARMLSKAHRQAIELLRVAKTVVLWGISLNMYDAEICVLLGDSHHFSPPERLPKRYVVVNPCSRPVQRLAFLTRQRDIVHVLPDGERCHESCCAKSAGPVRSDAA